MALNWNYWFCYPASTIGAVYVI